MKPKFRINQNIVATCIASSRSRRHQHAHLHYKRPTPLSKNPKAAAVAYLNVAGSEPGSGENVNDRVMAEAKAANLPPSFTITPQSHVTGRLVSSTPNTSVAERAAEAAVRGREAGGLICTLFNSSVPGAPTTCYNNACGEKRGSIVPPQQDMRGAAGTEAEEEDIETLLKKGMNGVWAMQWSWGAWSWDLRCRLLSQWT
jgi:hypothetical protein